ncbi:hypothetical protein ACLB2K_020347 [Fragaria x ananassa]
MRKQIRKSVVHCKDARSVWLELQERFSQTNTVNLFNIETAIHECVQEGNSVTSFFTNLKAFWDEKDALCTSTPCTCAAAIEAATALETQRTMKFLMGLNDDYAAVRSTIIGIDPLPTLNKAYAMVLRQEKQAAVSGNRGLSSIEAAAFYSSKEDRETWKKNSNKIDGSRCAKCALIARAPSQIGNLIYADETSNQQNLLPLLAGASTLHKTEKDFFIKPQSKKQRSDSDCLILLQIDFSTVANLIRIAKRIGRSNPFVQNCQGAAKAEP